jgi:hypothetical protein
MTQGEIISFLTRVVEHGLAGDCEGDLSAVIDRVHENLLLPVNQGGGSMFVDDDLYLCEYCRKDGYLVLNGWIFAIYGLYDYYRFSGKGLDALERSLDTLEKSIPDFVVPEDGWSYYDNKQRFSSPVYQFAHISLLDALYRLTGREAFSRAALTLRDGYNWRNRCKYTAIKISDKLKDVIPYATRR